MEAITSGSMLYHPIHGICRVQNIVKQTQSNKEVHCYDLMPSGTRYNKVRFFVPVDSFQESGFHKLVTEAEADKILAYFKAGFISPAETTKSFAEETSTWALARLLLSCSRNEITAKDQRRRQTLSRSARGLIRELAHVYQVTFKEAARRIRVSLECKTKVNPVVLAALENALEE